MLASVIQATIVHATHHQELNMSALKGSFVLLALSTLPRVYQGQHQHCVS